jgi:hypothetical protein
MTKVTKSKNHSWSAFCESVLSPLKHQNLHWRPQVDFCESVAMLPAQRSGTTTKPTCLQPSFLFSFSFSILLSLRQYSISRPKRLVLPYTPSPVSPPSLPLSLPPSSLPPFPQLHHCLGGLHKFFPLYNFVGNLEKSWLHGPALLRRVGLWERYGAREWALAKVLKTPISPGNSPSRYNLQRKPKVSERGGVSE